MKNAIENAKKFIKQILATHMARKQLSDSIIETESKPVIIAILPEVYSSTLRPAAECMPTMSGAVLSKKDLTENGLGL